jgi:DNA segregation ATPase FtsK/SpoIIIE, S-DNA-T family
VLDGFGTFKSEWETTSTRTQFYNLFMRILGEGRPLGVHAVISADRSGSVPTAVSANITRRIVLRQADQGAYSVLGVPKDVLDDSSPPGRAVVDGLEAQIGVLGATPNTAEQARELEVLADELRLRGAVEVPEIGALPRVLDPGDLPAEVDGAPTLGIAEDTLAPRGFEPVGTFVVTGPPRSGKTTAMRHLIDTVRRAHPDVRLFHIAGRRAQLGDHVEWMRSATKVEEVVELAKELTAVVSDESIPGKLMIVVEQVPQFSDSDAERSLKALFQAVNRSEHFLIGDADVSQLTSGFGFVSDFKAGRQGVALRPDSSDGDSLFKVPFGRVKRADYPEGRGILVQEGRQATVQLPLVPARRVEDAARTRTGGAAASDGD